MLVLDKRIGAGNNLIGDECCRVLEASKRSLLAVRGIQGDVQSLLEDVAARLRLRRLEEGDDACQEPKTLASLVSVMLYGQRARGGAPGYSVEPVIAGLDKDGEPYLCAQDGLGAKMTSRTFVVAGTAAQSLYGSCEALYKPDLEGGGAGRGGVRGHGRGPRRGRARGPRRRRPRRFLDGRAARGPAAGAGSGRAGGRRAGRV